MFIVSSKMRERQHCQTLKSQLIATTSFYHRQVSQADSRYAATTTTNDTHPHCDKLCKSNVNGITVEELGHIQTSESV